LPLPTLSDVMGSGADRTDLTTTKDGDHPTTSLRLPTPPCDGSRRRPPRAADVDVNLLQKTENLIREKLKKQKKICGIYYLVDYVENGVSVVYVGASKDVRKRVGQHVLNQDMIFCDVFVDPCEESELEEREAVAIAEFRPVLLGKNMPR